MTTNKQMLEEVNKRVKGILEDYRQDMNQIISQDLPLFNAALEVFSALTQATAKILSIETETCRLVIAKKVSDIEPVSKAVCEGPCNLTCHEFAKWQLLSEYGFVQEVQK